MASSTGTSGVHVDPRKADKPSGGMKEFTQRVVNFLKREDGPTAVEYAVMLALMIVVCITAITTIATDPHGRAPLIGFREVDFMPSWADGEGI